MKKDLFIDTNVAEYFANPKDIEYKRLIRWILKFDENNLNDNAYLVVSQRLIIEYTATCGRSYSATNITVILDKLMSQHRLIKYTKEQIAGFKNKYYNKTLRKRFMSNYYDVEFHIPTVLMSDRKYALARDNNLRKDLQAFPGFVVKVGEKPSDIPYEQ